MKVGELARKCEETEYCCECKYREECDEFDHAIERVNVPKDLLQLLEVDLTRGV